MSITSVVIFLLLTFMYTASTTLWVARIVPENLRASLLFATDAKAVTSPFRYTFNADGTLVEAGSMAESSSPYFWLNSGARLPMKEGVGQTLQGPLAAGDLWRLLYATANSLDTGNGYYPQNLFRLITRSNIWNNVSEEVRFKITSTNLTDTPNRDGWSGILLMSRYRDSQNLYYAGIRMDGAAVIKKKYKGAYTTLAQKNLPWASASTYNRVKNPNLIPAKKWMRLKSTTVTQPDNTVLIELFLDENDDGIYEKILSTTDRSNTVTGPAYMGVRTDYMDVQFDDYTLKNM